MTPKHLETEFDRVCNELGVSPGEMRFGRTRHRSARLVTVARAMFLLRAKKAGATIRQAAEMLELTERSISHWWREFRQRGLA